jgi:hypothetical protein
MPYISYIIIITAFTNTEGVFTLCAMKKKKILQVDGSYLESEYLPAFICLDHRYLDGALGAKLIKKTKELFNNPKGFEIY